MKRQLVLVLVLLTIPCLAAAGMRVTSKRAAGVDLSSYTTYSWLAADSQESGPLVAAGTRLAAVIEEVGDRELARAGMEKVPAGESQIILRYSAVGRDVVPVGSGKAGIDETVAWIASDGVSLSVQEGSLIIEAVEAETGEVLWLGWATDIIEVPPRAAKITKKATKATQKILRLLPRE